MLPGGGSLIPGDSGKSGNGERRHDKESGTRRGGKGGKSGGGDNDYDFLTSQSSEESNRVVGWGEPNGDGVRKVVRHETRHETPTDIPTEVVGDDNGDKQVNFLIYLFIH